MVQQCALNICHVSHCVLGTGVQGESERPKLSLLEDMVSALIPC